MDIKEFLDVRSEKLNIVDDTLGVLAGIGAYHFAKAQTQPNWRVNNDYGAVALTGLSVLHAFVGIETAEFVRKKSRSIRLGLSRLLNKDDSMVNDVEDYQTIVLPDEDIANTVMDEIEKLFLEKKSVNVSDLYNICGLSSSSRDIYIGWDDISNFRITKREDGQFLIDAPKAKKL